MSGKCYFCGMSTLQGPRRRSRCPKKSYVLTEDYIASRPYIIDYAHHLSKDREMTVHDRICRPCSQRADRFEMKRRKAQEQEAADIAMDQAAIKDIHQHCLSQSPEAIQNDPFEDVPEKAPHNIPHPQDLDSIQDLEGIQDLKSIQDLKGIQDHFEQPKTSVFSIPGYRRISCNSTKCVISGCTILNLHRIHLSIRYDILSEQNLYIPRGTRVCVEHVASDVWNNLVTHSRHLHDTFNSVQISDMLKLLQRKCLQYLDFERLDTINDGVFQYYIGFSKSAFLQILQETPSLSVIFKKTPKIALATALCKSHTGHSNESLSSVFRMTPQTFSRMMRKASKCLELSREKLISS